MQNETRLKSSLATHESSTPLNRGVPHALTDLSDAKRRLNLALETLELGQWEYVPRDNKILWTPTQFKIFGRPDFDGTIEHFMTFVMPEGRQRLSEELGTAVECADIFNTQFEIYHPELGVRLIRTRAYPERDDKGVLVRLLGLNWDITESYEKEAELERQRLVSLSQARLVAVGEMAAGIAHEVNNPLAIIVGHAERILHDLKEESPNKESLRFSAEKILTTSGRIQKIVRGLRSLSRDTRADPFELHSLTHIIKDSLVLAEDRLKSNGIHVELEEPQETIKIYCRPTEISQVFINLLNNSVDALKNQVDGLISIKVRKIHFKQKSVAQISFSDNGSGIPAPLVSQIMKPFFTTKSSQEGTGLGLSISENIVKAHHGSIRLDTNSKLTKFIIELPLA